MGCPIHQSKHDEGIEALGFRSAELKVIDKSFIEFIAIADALAIIDQQIRRKARGQKVMPSKESNIAILQLILTTMEQGSMRKVEESNGSVDFLIGIEDEVSMRRLGEISPIREYIE